MTLSHRSMTVALALASLSLAACGQSTGDSAPETAATMPEGENETTGAIQPGMGSPPEPGGGVPGASDPATAPTTGGTDPIPPGPQDSDGAPGKAA